ncbi:MAG: CcoQ/FixQ family Cbb3-type cytochrome c oxidase assembly chaperone [Bacteroidetes bacterium]|nr:MAG: CcoQ/FixQ family Cbb3-type cytochrome c oxidase assembly chaperone [Bacteroidota bacterium]
MFKHILANAGNINWMAIFALITFFLMFLITLFVVFGKRKSYIEKMSNLPLEDSISKQEEIN